MKSIAVVLLTMGLGVLTAATAGAADVTTEKKKSDPKKGDPVPEWAKPFDKNGDGVLDRQETAAAVKARRDEAIKPYDTNGDGVLDDTETKAMIAKRRKQHADMTAQRKAELEKKAEETKEKAKDKGESKTAKETKKEVVKETKDKEKDKKP